MSNLIDDTELKEIFSSVLADVGVEGTLRYKSSNSYVNHLLTGSTTTDYPVFYVPPSREIIEIVKGGQRESVEVEKVICQAEGFDETPPRLPDSKNWTFIDALGEEYKLVKVEPKQLGITVIVFTLYLVR